MHTAPDLLILSPTLHYQAVKNQDIKLIKLQAYNLQQLSATKGQPHVDCGSLDELQPLSLAIPPRISKITTGDGYSQFKERNGKFCITVVPARILACYIQNGQQNISVILVIPVT